ncbi:hypothetical protein N7E81_10335 [Reichenbachiella carrageenanivorans]|uniref:DUF3291 domain-containing protein n=1 Tax=Reichenbachiella carrageenanivorans TaxID=2979869 RepID=A0ABY6CV29_9BACT|nr:hypothetical protein [Reichenbachiella carrageenanivorans]UXX77767.1 hypothetical protein N7E81_10335 [Reichenbachiella carrageenanivorans]
MYVSITRLKLKSIWLLPKFAKQSGRVAKQAQDSPGYIKVKLSNRWFRYFYTLTLWRSRADMQQFVIHGDHKVAMQEWSKFATEVKALGYETEAAPKWKEVRKRIATEGKTTR